MSEENFTRAKEFVPERSGGRTLPEGGESTAISTLPEPAQWPEADELLKHGSCVLAASLTGSPCYIHPTGDVYSGLPDPLILPLVP